MVVTKTYFTTRQINIMRGRAQRAAEMPEPVVDGWSKCSADPMALLAAFKSLRIRDGYVLRAYQYYAGGDGNAFVWALPVDADFPEPQSIDGAGRVGLFNPPRPPRALERTMQGIEGDDTPRSYLSASIFCRELGEFGAFWHGCGWSTRSIVGADPTVEDPDRWQWSEKRPTDWRPCVELSRREARVIFYCLGGLGGWTIRRHVDTYGRRNDDVRGQSTELAFGGGGFLF